MRHKLIYCNRGLLPVPYAFCPSEKAWDNEMQRLDINHPYLTSDARTHFLCNNSTNDKLILVSVHDRVDYKYTGLEIAGLCFHEATHVFQYLCEAMGEDKPSVEFEAYSIHFIGMELLSAYQKTRRKVFK